MSDSLLTVNGPDKQTVAEVGNQIIQILAELPECSKTEDVGLEAIKAIGNAGSGTTNISGCSIVGPLRDTPEVAAQDPEYKGEPAADGESTTWYSFREVVEKARSLGRDEVRIAAEGWFKDDYFSVRDDGLYDMRSERMSAYPLEGYDQWPIAGSVKYVSMRWRILP